MRIEVIGGGPAGLYFARLVGLHTPQHTVVVFEQNAPDATFGFGIGLGGKARDLIHRVDPQVHDRIAAAMVFANQQRIHLNGADIVLDYSGKGGAIGRLEMLHILQQACAEVGVEVRHNTRIEDLGAFAGYDLVVGADGVNSVVRRLHGDAFGTAIYHLTNHFSWYGVARAMRPGSLVFRTTPAGRFVGHYYPYAPAMSTFVAECDAATWNGAGLDRMTDDERKSYMERVFAPELAGDRLIDNRSIWRNFPVVTNRNWYVGNTVLIGDALLSAHFSIGSGTRLSMDDAMALFEAIRAGGGVAECLSRYVKLRQPIRENFRIAAERSFNWYERLAEIMDQAPIDFVHDFLTRTGRIDANRLAEYAPGFFKLYSETKAAQTRAAG
jgi:2-polyprenyl-6-methoxyphenol hydroxylase-like FAD-dependent oxidoreductase